MASQDKSSGSVLIAASLLQRGFGFLAAFVLSRQFGVEAAGLYTSIQISANSATSPLATPLAHTATLLAVENRGQRSMRAVLFSCLPVAACISAVAALFSVALILMSVGQVEQEQRFPVWIPVVIAVLLSLATVFYQLVAAVHHGYDRSKRPAVFAALCALFGIASIWPVSSFAGVLGALCLAVFIASVPVVCMIVLVTKEAGQREENVHHASLNVSPLVLMAIPAAAAALTRTAAVWFCSIYMASLHYGSAGVGLVTIGLQWTMLMHLPLLAWDGRIVASLGVARERSRAQLLQTLSDWQRRCFLIIGLIGVSIAVLSPWIEDLYRLDKESLRWILTINTFAAVASAITILQERLYFCQSRQKEWFVISLVGDGLMVALTVILIQNSILAIPVANLISSLFVLLYTRIKSDF